MNNKQFLLQLSTCLEERKVEDTYNELLKCYFPNLDIQYPCNCDGYFTYKIDDKDLNVLIEYKYDCDFKNNKEICKVLCQVIAYLKKFQNENILFPNVVFVADKNECLVYKVSNLIDYLNVDGIDWDIAPSTFDNNTQLFNLLLEDNIQPWTFDINENFDFKNIYDIMIGYLNSSSSYITINEHNVDGIFQDFEKRVLNDKKLNSNDKVSIFYGVVTNDENHYKHPRKKNILVAPVNDNTTKDVKINSDQYDSFIQQFDTNMSISQKRKLTAICDRLLEDTSRRLKGEFYTPTPFCDYSHKMISSVLGSNWRNEYVVWDMAWGCGNLTRDYDFNELYCSTLEQADLNTASGYNVNAVKFQFDFLNDGLEKLPDGLIQAFRENKKIVFFFNPPYSTSAGDLDKSGKKRVLNISHIQKEIQSLKLRSCSINLYTQFLYRVCKIKRQFGLTDCYIAVFSPSSFDRTTGFKKFRELFLNQFEYKDSYMINAGEFSGTGSTWSILFSIWKSVQNEEEL